jgi:hypothetical protein
MDLDLGAMRIHCPATAFDDLVGALRALDRDEAGAVERAAGLAREYDRAIGDLTPYQRAMVQATYCATAPTTRRMCARAGFRSIVRAVLTIHKKKRAEEKKRRRREKTATAPEK